MYTMGVDIGSASSKAVILKDGKDVLAAEVVQVGTGSTGPKKAMEMAFEKSGVKEEEIDFIIATGYGRFSLEDAMSEISCHAKGIYHLVPTARTIIDIGGQDAKAIRLDNKGGIKQFFMNDKCAAGTGRFIEVMARVLETTLDEMATLDEQAEDTAPISSTCTVFAESEVISQLSKGTDRKSIARGVHMSVASRACGLAYRAGLEKDIRESRNKVSGLVRIGVCPPCLSLASTPIPALNREFPDLRFRVWVMDNQSLERHMQERNLDFALVQLPVQNANYAMLPLARQEFVAVYGQGVPPPEARSIGVEELREAPLLLSRRRDGGGGYDLIMRAFQDKGVRPNVVLDSQDTRLLHKLLRQGMSAVAILPEREVAAGTLESFPMRRLDVPGLDLAPVLIWLEHAYLSRTARRVIQCLHKVNADPGEQPDFER